MQHELADIAGSKWDVVVIGAGINGAATARELTMAGYSVLLCEKGDFAGGATGRSSRMLHCGLRYFEAEAPVRTFGLHPRRFLQAVTMARAGMKARHEIATTAPEAVTPFTMCFPVYPESPVRPWHLDAGLTLLKTLGPNEPPLEYRKITSNFEAQLPFARDLRDHDRLQSIATYREYLFDWPDRFCVDAALEAEAGGATVLNFCEAQLVGRNAAGLWQIVLAGQDGSTANVSARLVYNMAGTWIDTVNAGACATATPSRRLIRGTKGSHIMVRLPKSYRGYGIATMHRKGMPFYCLPSHDDFFYFGPTETPFEGDAGDVAATEAEIDFLLGEANFLLPGLGLTRNDVVFTWAGVRPLTFDVDQPMGRRSREIHDLAADGLPGVVAMTAGPVMSHRSAARTMRERAEAVLGKPFKPVDEPAPWRIAKDAPRLSDPEPSGNLRRVALRRAVSDEHARDLKGILYTRTALAWRRHLARHEVEDAAASVADLLGWTPEQSAEEVDHFLAYQRTVFRAGTPARSPDRPYAMPTPTGDMQP